MRLTTLAVIYLLLRHNSVQLYVCVSPTLVSLERFGRYGYNSLVCDSS